MFFLVRIASTAVLTGMLGGTKEQIINAVSNAFIDGGALRTYETFYQTQAQGKAELVLQAAQCVSHIFP